MQTETLIHQGTLPLERIRLRSWYNICFLLWSFSQKTYFSGFIYKAFLCIGNSLDIFLSALHCSWSQQVGMPELLDDGRDVFQVNILNLKCYPFIKIYLRFNHIHIKCDFKVHGLSKYFERLVYFHNFHLQKKYIWWVDSYFRS